MAACCACSASGCSTVKRKRALIDRLPAEALRADVLVVAHHGSGTSSGAAWLEAVRPSAAVFQLGYANR